MPISEFSAALNQVCSEKGITPEAVLETIKLALISAYRKEFPGVPQEELLAEINPESGEMKILHQGKDVTPSGFGRIAAQTAKQVLLQKLREEEKTALLAEYEKKVGAIVSGFVFRVEKGVVVVDLGRAQGIMPPSEQLSSEDYRANQRIKVLVSGIREGEKGEQIIVSRADPRFVIELFALEVPEIHSGVVKIEAIAREAGSRTKVAVSSSEENVDPIGSCVGQKGVRVQAVVAELGNEKIDIVPYYKEEDKFVAAALSPAKVNDIELNKERKIAVVKVADDQLSLAIGKEGQNVRLAAKLTGYKIDIHGETETSERPKSKKEEGSELLKLGLSKRVASLLEKAGIAKATQLKEKNGKGLSEIKGLGPKAIEEIKAINWDKIPSSPTPKENHAGQN